MQSKRFSKALALQVLDVMAARITREQGFNTRTGTSQLAPNDIKRAVEYGRMKAFEQFAEWIEEGFAFFDLERDTHAK